MTTTPYSQSIKPDPQIAAALTDLVRKHQLAQEQLDEQQFVDCLRQVLLSGDFMRYIRQDSAQCYVYEPYREVEKLRGRIWDARMRIGMLHTRTLESIEKRIPPIGLEGLASSLKEIDKTLAGIRPEIL